MRNFLKVSVFLLICAVVFLGVNNSNIYGVGYTNTIQAGTLIRNVAKVTGGNFSVGTNVVTNIVGRIAGGAWQSSVDATTANIGYVYTNHTFLTNLGNDVFTFDI